MAGNELWRHFASVCCSNRELLQQVLCSLTRQDRGHLRLVNKQLREAVGGAVTDVEWCILHSKQPRRDMITVFPAAATLAINIIYNENDYRNATATDMCLALQHIAAVQPKLLQQVTSLTLNLILKGPMSTSAIMALHNTLKRCTRLQSLQVAWQDHERNTAHMSVCVASFAGQGSTPDAQRTSMQQQLRSLTSGPELLTPSSWPTHNCLTQLQLFGLPATQFAAMYSSALATASLVQLTVQPRYTRELYSSQGFSQLSKLTGLALYAEDDDSEEQEQGQALLAAVACATSLQELSLDGTAIQGAPEGTIPIPSSWSRLSALTALNLVEYNLQLRSLHGWPALRHVQLDHCTVLGTLAQLSVLPALTCLDALPSTFKLDGGDAAPVSETATTAASSVPSPLQDKLLELSWGWTVCEMQTMSQLTALTKLSLAQAEVSPELCWQLAALPNLQHLALLDPKTAKQAPNMAAAGLHAPWPSLKTLTPGTPDSLTMLACWTDVGPGLSLAAGSVPSGTGPVVFSALGAGWLAAMLSNPAARAAAATAAAQSPLLGIGGSNVFLVLSDSSDVQQFLRALQDAGRSKAQGNGSSSTTITTTTTTTTAVLSLLLGEDVGPEAFGQLLEASHLLPKGTVHVANNSSCAGHDANLGIAVPAQLPASHFWNLRGLVAPGLRMLQIDSCGGLIDTHVALLAGAAPGLRMLALRSACNLTDAALFALLGCQQLEGILVKGCKAISGAAVALLLDRLGKLCWLQVGKAAVDDVTQSMALLHVGVSSSSAVAVPMTEWVVACPGEEGVVVCSSGSLTPPVVRRPQC